MAFKKELSEFSKEKLLNALSEPWFNELLEVLINIGTFAEPSYSGTRPLSEMEHQALSGKFSQGFVTCANHIPRLAQPAKEKRETLPPQFGTLKPETPDPKSLSNLTKPKQ